MRHEPAILLVTCCLERSRYELARDVIKNIHNTCPRWWAQELTVFDNASTWMGIGELKASFRNVVRADRNVGYWSAVDWWLHSMRDDPPRYTYIIESDMLHQVAGTAYIDDCVAFLDEHPELGSMRLHEYSVANRHLYDKDRPLPGSRRSLWQSHTNRVSGEPVQHHRVRDRFWRTNFLTQLPALNRYDAMLECFLELEKRSSFTEPDFQALYHDRYPAISIMDGGMFNCDQNTYGTPDAITGSWTDPAVLARLGYQETRRASIVPRDQYTVTRLP